MYQRFINEAVEHMRKLRNEPGTELVGDKKLLPKFLVYQTETNYFVEQLLDDIENIKENGATRDFKPYSHRLDEEIDRDI